MLARIFVVALLAFASIVRTPRTPVVDFGMSSPSASRLVSTSASISSSDFNGDDVGDFAIGIPYEDVGSASNAGAVQILYGSTTSKLLTDAGGQLWTQNSSGVRERAETGDRFGSALAIGDFDGDGYEDLAIGVPGEDIKSETVTNAGAVEVLYGSASGLTATGNQLWTQDTPYIDGVAETGDQFGSALAAGDFDHPPPYCPTSKSDDLAVGVPREDLGSAKRDAGAVNVLFSGSNGLSNCWNQLWTQDSEGVPDPAEAGDHFGGALAAGNFDGYGVSLAVGVPDENVGSITDAGLVNILLSYPFGFIASSESWTEALATVQDEAETADHFGFAMASADLKNVNCSTCDMEDLAIGVYGEDTAAGSDVGAVHVLLGDETDHGLMDFGQDYILPLTEQAGEKFGYSLATGVATEAASRPFLAIGAPYSDLGGVADAGLIELHYGGDATRAWTQDSTYATPDPTDVLDQAEAGDLFGWSLGSIAASGPYGTAVVVGVPNEDVDTVADAGAINVLYWGSGGLEATENQYWNQDSGDVGGTAETGDHFGRAVAGPRRSIL